MYQNKQNDLNGYQGRNHPENQTSSFLKDTTTPILKNFIIPCFAIYVECGNDT